MTRDLEEGADRERDDDIGYFVPSPAHQVFTLLVDSTYLPPSPICYLDISHVEGALDRRSGPVQYFPSDVVGGYHCTWDKNKIMRHDRGTRNKARESMYVCMYVYGMVSVEM